MRTGSGGAHVLFTLEVATLVVLPHTRTLLTRVTVSTLLDAVEVRGVGDVGLAVTGGGDAKEARWRCRAKSYWYVVTTSTLQRGLASRGETKDLKPN